MGRVMFSVFFCVCLVLLQVDISRAHQVSTKIINGTNVKDGTYRFMVSIHGDFNEHFCGGAILNEYYVLTAAHCCDSYEAYEIKIKAGITNLNASSEFLNVAEIIAHKSYDSSTGEYDICLLKMEKSFALMENLIEFVDLPKRDDKPKVNQDVFVAGWGRTNDKLISNELKSVKVIVADQNVCKDAYKTYPFKITKKHFCIQSPSGIRGPCVRDSGGPVVSYKKVKGENVPVILGIVSWADTKYCGNPKYPDVLTRVSKYLSWIKHNSDY